MQKTFKAVRSGDIDSVRKIFDTNPDEINAVTKQPPKKDDGQSLLQVALKSGNLDIANLLLDYHANVNFMESEDCCNSWRMPVLHDAIRSAIMSSRWNSRKYGSDVFEVHSTKEKADKAYAVLKRILESGADILSKDSYGNTTLERAILDARQLLPTYNYKDKTLSDNRRITEELRHDFARVFVLLYSFGASNQWTDRVSGKPLTEYYAAEPVAEFINLCTPEQEKKSLWKKMFGK